MAARYTPYSRQSINEDDIAAVIEVLRSDWLTTGPAVDLFERAIVEAVGARHAVAVSSGTAGLHAAMHAIGVGSGDEVIVPAMTFAATANAVLYQGGTPVFADVQPETLLISPSSAEALVTPRTKAIVAVDYAGQPADYAALRRIADRHGLCLIADACHSLGASEQGRPCGSLADLSVLSFHPVKPITTGEGGMVTTNHADLAARMRVFRNHGLDTDHRQRQLKGVWHYEMTDLGYNYRLTDIQCALGLSQIKRLPAFLEKRRQIAAMFDAAFAGTAVRPLARRPEVGHGYHLYVVRIERRDLAFTYLRERGIGVNVHYVPVHLHGYYRETLGTREGQCPEAEAAYREILSLPIFPDLSHEDRRRVITELVHGI